MAVTSYMERLLAMLDDPDDKVGVVTLALMLASGEDLSELTAQLQESPDPLIRRRIHTLQNAVTMRERRRRIYYSLNKENEDDLDIPAELIDLHLLWFDKDHPAEVKSVVDDFLKLVEKFPLETLEDAEFLMRKNCFLPEKESTIRPENYCIGTVLFHRQGATSVLLALLWHLLGRKKFQLVQVLGNFALMDDKGQILFGSGSWQLEKLDGAQPVRWSSQMLMRYIASTLLSCAVNSDSYRYVMSITRALTGDESKHVFDNFPYPFCSAPADEDEQLEQ